MPSAAATRCTYTYEPPDDVPRNPQVEIPRGSPEQCPHDAVDETSRRCLFHHGESEYPSDRFTDQFLQVLADSETSPVFAGGSLPGLKLEDRTITTPTDAPIDLRGAVIDGDLDLTNATIDVPLLLDGAAITGSLHADGAVFQAPVSFAGADISGRVHAHEATIDGGVVATDLNAGYVDCRRLTVDGPLILEKASFASNLLLAHATIEGDLRLDNAVFDWSLDSTAASIDGDVTGTAMTVDADCDFVAAEVEDAVELRKSTVNGATDWSHATIGGDLRAADCEFDGELSFDDVSIGGEALVFDGATFRAKADFATMDLRQSRLSFAHASFEDEVWFTHATIGEVATFDGATFAGMAHLRDAVFEDDLILRNTGGTGQFFLHGSTVDGECDCTSAHFDHFQFSATVRGTTDFSHARFDEKAIFTSSTFGDRVWFDGASFAGFADFSDTRFTAKATFEDTEFLVDPTFDATRFAVDPNLRAADFSVADAIDFADRRSQMVLAHPETLQNEGVTIPLERVTDTASIPAAVSKLATDKHSNTELVVDALSDFDQQSWYDFCRHPLRTARTAVARLPDPDSAVLVFGISINATADGAALLHSARVAGVYCRTDDEIVFGHLDPALDDVDYLLPIPASDAAFESGAAVATSTELHEAALRNEMFRAVVLRKQSTDGPPVHQMVLPVLIGAEEFA
ncbi:MULTISPECIES: pentapeptide repeat-containing protein [Haloarcula]|uniref:pentapeptide repeat-containing protein n=1 Tax=Haloarcula TaxID=2237 RepID=UPI0023EE0FBA|nr:pentapeptide repeat-containing protein [Halomicroarcula sp. XH51]